jgi:hypothetical protein
MIDVPLYSDKNTNQFHIHDYTSCFVLKAQINCMWFKKEFKVKGFLFLHVMTFWYSMYFQFWHKVCTLHNGNTWLACCINNTIDI